MRSPPLIRKESLVLLALLLASCTKEKRDVPMETLATGGGSTNFASLQADIFSLSCASSGCHDNRATPAGSLNLSSRSESYSSLVNQLSTQANGMKLVSPSDPDNSYLIAKLLGTQSAVGGNGVRMPQYAAALSSQDIERIVVWINNGAPNN